MSEIDSGMEGVHEVSCDNCVGACCRAGASLTLSEIEVSQHRRAMNLKAVLKPKNYPQQLPFRMEQLDESGRRSGVQVTLKVPKHYGFYILRSNCGNLTEDSRCGVYDERPKACATYEVGSQECLAARAAFGLDGHEAQVPLEREQPLQIRIPRFHQQ